MAAGTTINDNTVKNPEYYSNGMGEIIKKLQVYIYQLEHIEWEDDIYTKLVRYMTGEGYCLIKEMEDVKKLHNYCIHIDMVVNRYGKLVTDVERRKMCIEEWKRIHGMIKGVKDGIDNPILKHKVVGPPEFSSKID